MTAIRNQNAVNELISQLKDITSNVAIDVTQPEYFNYFFHVKRNEMETTIKIGKAAMDDMESAISLGRQSYDYQIMKSYLMYQFIIEMGKKGMLVDFKVSEYVLKEVGRWDENATFDILPDDENDKLIVNGLKKIEVFLSNLMTACEVSIPSVAEDRKDIEMILKWYADKGSLASHSVSIRSFSLLKAGMLTELIALEEKKHEHSKSSRAVKAYEEKIYSIVEQLRENPYPSVQLPDCMFEYAAYRTELGSDDKL